MIRSDDEKKISHCIRYEHTDIVHHRIVNDTETCPKCLLMKRGLIYMVESIIHRKWLLTLFPYKYHFWMYTALMKETSWNVVKRRDILSEYTTEIWIYNFICRAENQSFYFLYKKTWWFHSSFIFLWKSRWYSSIVIGYLNKI